MSDADAASRIRADGIDILVDMNGHTAHNRLPLFLHKPAPIQVTWLGYLATTGITAIDYRFTDAYADPPGLTDSLHTETMWRLPSTQWCYQPYVMAPDVAPPPHATNGFATFGCLNNASKMSPTVLELWARILGALPQSRLLLLSPERSTRTAYVHAFFAEQGIARDRVEFVTPRPVADYLALYHRMDIALDSYPCVGGTTTLDALWMGVPVVTLAGDRPFARSGASIVRNAGLADLVADDGAAYVRNAVALAHDHERRAALRQSLRPLLASSVLTNRAQFAADVEAAYAEMHHRAQVHAPYAAQ
jgi:protein O-GlcNAc transferase